MCSFVLLVNPYVMSPFFQSILISNQEVKLGEWLLLLVNELLLLFERSLVVFNSIFPSLCITTEPV
jgi:hypothetical protein